MVNDDGSPRREPLDRYWSDAAVGLERQDFPHEVNRRILS